MSSTHAFDCLRDLMDWYHTGVLEYTEAVQKRLLPCAVRFLMGVHA